MNLIYKDTNIKISRLARFSCKLCSFVGMTLNQCRLHLGSEHPNWPNETNQAIKNLQDSSHSTSARVELELEMPGTSSASVGTSGTTSTVDPGAGTSKETVHTNPGWCSHLVKNFKSVVISKCCQRTRDAVEMDEKIQVRGVWVVGILG